MNPSDLESNKPGDANIVNIEAFREEHLISGFRSDIVAFIFLTHLDNISRLNVRSSHASQYGLKISIPNYFKEKCGSDNINNTALLLIPELLEGYSYNRSGIESVIRTPKKLDQTDFEIPDSDPKAIIKKSLGLDDPILARSMLKFIHSKSSTDPSKKRAKFMHKCGDKDIYIVGILDSFDLNIVKSIPEMEAFVKESGYSDFLDYLMDVIYKIKSISQDLEI